MVYKCQNKIQTSKQTQFWKRYQKFNIIEFNDLGNCISEQKCKQKHERTEQKKHREWNKENKIKQKETLATDKERVKYNT